jgi:SAM-dependent methyltransferase
VNLLNAPGIHYLIRRFGTWKLRQAAYDARTLSGKWDYSPDDVSPVLVEAILRYAGRGKVALMGCGTGALAAVLDRSGCPCILGIDLSTVAIERATMRGLAHARFEVADIASWDGREKYDAIVFEESLYYLRPKERVPVLTRLQLSLTPTGAFVITVSDAVRYRAMLDMIRSQFHVLEDRDKATWDSGQRLLVFRCPGQPERFLRDARPVVRRKTRLHRPPVKRYQLPVSQDLC